VPTLLPVEWGLTKRYEYQGKIVSLSSGGCLLETAAVQPLYGKRIFIRLPLPNKDFSELQGEVAYFLRDVGFGVQFSELTDDDKSILRLLMQHYRENLA
jgi:hypothetical protein